MIGDRTIWLVDRTVGDPDEYGNDTHTTVETPVYGCQVQARASSEDVQAKDQVVSGWFVYAPPAPAVKSTAQVRIIEAGPLWEVDGDVGTWGEGVLAGQEFALRRVTG